MEFVEHSAQVAGIEPDVELRRREAFVPYELLYESGIASGFSEMQ